MADAHGLDIDLEKAKARTYEIYLDLIAGRLQPSPGSHEFVAWCRQLGLKLAVATSADSIKLNGNLRAIGLDRDAFDAIVAGEDVENKKPAPDAFVISAEKLGLDPSVCLVIEDAVAGVRAAKTAGCRCLALTTSFGEGDLLQAGADWIAPNLASVPEGVLVW